MARNSAIVIPRYHYGNDGELVIQPVDMILAWPSDKPGGGGTGQGMRLGESLGIPVLNLARMDHHDLYNLCERIKAL